jgi:hypothetical protein
MEMGNLENCVTAICALEVLAEEMGLPHYAELFFVRELSPADVIMLPRRGGVP